TASDINNGTLTIKQGSTTLGTFSANQSSNKTITVDAPPTNNNQLTNGAGYAKTNQLFSKNYNDLTNKPSIPAAANNGTLTIKQGGVSKGTFGANQATNKTINVDAPHPIDTNAALGNSDTEVPSQKAVKTYVDQQVIN